MISSARAEHTARLILTHAPLAITAPDRFFLGTSCGTVHCQAGASRAESVLLTNINSNKRPCSGEIGRDQAQQTVRKSAACRSVRDRIQGPCRRHCTSGRRCWRRRSAPTPSEDTAAKRDSRMKSGARLAVVLRGRSFFSCLMSPTLSGNDIEPPVCA
jgi:hypothetical protein